MRNPGTAYDDPRLGKDPQPAHMDDYVDTRTTTAASTSTPASPTAPSCSRPTRSAATPGRRPGAIWYAVLSGDGIKADCDFATFADLTVAAAGSAHGDGSAEQKAVRSAWEQVGVLGASAAAPAAAGRRRRRLGPGAGSPSGPRGGRRRAPTRSVLLRRTGGFAGQVRERRLALGELPERDAKDWQHLLAAPTLQRIAASTEGTHPDAYIYSVVCDEAGCDVTLQEPHLPEAIHSLFERTLAEY